MISTSSPVADLTAPGTVTRPGERRRAVGRLLMGTAFVLGCVAVIMSALAVNAPATAPSHGDAMFVVITAVSILLGVVGVAATICGWVAGGRGAAGTRHAGPAGGA